MNQIQYEIIKKLIQNGAPALAEELLGALDAYINDHNELIKKYTDLTTEKAENESKEVLAEE